MQPHTLTYWDIAPLFQNLTKFHGKDKLKVACRIFVIVYKSVSQQICVYNKFVSNQYPFSQFTCAAMIQAFFSLYYLLKNTLPPKVFFNFFKEQNLFFFHKFDGF